MCPFISPYCGLGGHQTLVPAYSPPCATLLGIYLLVGCSADHRPDGAGSLTDIPTPGSSTGSTGSTTSSTGGSTGDVKLDVGFESTGATDGATCEVIHVQGVTERPEILLMLDLSTSMNDPMMFDGEQVARWDALWFTVDAVLGAFDEKADFGVQTFPTADPAAASCDVDDPVTVPIAPANAANILSTIPGVSEGGPTGLTPTYEALAVARTHMADIKSTKDQFMILLTDGYPHANCGPQNSQDPVADLIGQIHGDGVPTYMVGISPMSERFVDALNAFAEAGGTPLPGTQKYYDATDGDILLMHLEDIVQTTLSCVVSLDEAPMYPELTQVDVGGTAWPQVTDCASQDGWIYSVPHTEITFCGAACDDLQNNGGGASIEYHCPEG